jgi:capsular polysaccharide biosynthesis protein
MNFAMRKTTLLIAGILLIIVGAGMALSTVLVVFLLPPTYASTARIAPAVTNPTGVATEVEKIQSEAILSQVITNLDLAKKWGEKYKEGELRMDVTRSLLKRDLIVRPSRNTLLVEITVEGNDRVEAAAIANRIAEVYRDSALAAKGPDPKSTVQIIETAQPSLRPLRSRIHWTIGIGCGVGVLLSVLGVALLVASGRQAKDAA